MCLYVGYACYSARVCMRMEVRGRPPLCAPVTFHVINRGRFALTSELSRLSWSRQPLFPRMSRLCLLTPGIPGRLPGFCQFFFFWWRAGDLNCSPHLCDHHLGHLPVLFTLLRELHLKSIMNENLRQQGLHI